MGGLVGNPKLRNPTQPWMGRGLCPLGLGGVWIQRLNFSPCHIGCLDTNHKQWVLTAHCTPTCMQTKLVEENDHTPHPPNKTIPLENR
jgi:hypothetical protein